MASVTGTPRCGERASQASRVVGDAAATALLDDQHTAPVQLRYPFSTDADHLSGHLGTLA